MTDCPHFLTCLLNPAFDLSSVLNFLLFGGLAGRLGVWRSVGRLVDRSAGWLVD